MKKINNNKLLISVLMPVFNAASYVEEAIESVLAQTCRHFELIVVDDGSTDNSWNILQNLAKKDKRIHVFRNKKNSGIGYTRKRLANLAKGQFAAIMDADDIMFPNRLAIQAQYLLKHPNVVVVGGQCITIDEQGTISGSKKFPIHHEEIYNMMFTRMSIQQPASMINLALVPEEFPWYDNTVSPVEDLDNLFRLFQSGKFANVSEDVLYYRVYPTSSSLKNIKRTFWLTMKVRARAVFAYGYKPTLLAWIVMIPQMIAVLFLPSRLVFPVYSYLRGIKNKSLTLYNEMYAVVKATLR